MSNSTNFVRSIARCALAAAIGCTSLLVGCDRGRDASGAGASASAPAASGATR